LDKQERAFYKEVRHVKSKNKFILSYINIEERLDENIKFRNKILTKFEDSEDVDERS